MKNTVIGLSLLVAATAIVIGGTSAFFSDSETSTGNTFAAGTLDLQINDKNGEAVGTIFDSKEVGNLKPGDKGSVKVNLSNKGTINGKEVLASLIATENDEVSCTEPEMNDSKDDCVNRGIQEERNSGELCKALLFQIKDGETIITGENYVSLDQVDLKLNRKLKAGTDHDIKISYMVSENAENEIQSDSCVISFSAKLNQEVTTP